MTNCERCIIWNTKDMIPDKPYNELHSKSLRYRCKITGLIIKTWEIPNRCFSYQISEMGKKMLEIEAIDKQNEEKYWRDRYDCGKDNIPEEYLNKFIKEKDESK